MIIPNEKNKIILEIISDEQAKEISEKIKEKKPKKVSSAQKDKNITPKRATALSPNWGEYFVYDFDAKDKIMPILESAFNKFTEKPLNLEDAMGRVKYALVSFLSSTKTENVSCTPKS